MTKDGLERVLDEVWAQAQESKPTESSLVCLSSLSFSTSLSVCVFDAHIMPTPSSLFLDLVTKDGLERVLDEV